MVESSKDLLSVCDRVGEVILGKKETIKLLLCAFLAGGHVLLEDRPGVGKSTLARTFAASLGLELKRIQVTADLMPLDIIGGNIFDKESGRLVFRPGPLFSHVVMLDELNRASARTQSALLEAMEESQVTIEGVSHQLPRPFFVIATQNSIEHQGTYEIPDSQLDRFLMKLSLGMPQRKDEKLILSRLQEGAASQQQLARQLPIFEGPEEIVTLMNKIEKLYVDQSIIDYILDIAEFTRSQFLTGLSPRAIIGLLKASKAYAFLSERDYVNPDDVKAIFAASAMHRLGLPQPDSLSQARLLSLRSKTKRSQQRLSIQEEFSQWILTQIRVRFAS